MHNITFLDRIHQLKGHTHDFLLYPPYWRDTTQHIITPLSWTSVEFNDANESLIPTTKGVYCFVVKPPIPNFITPKYVFYVGKSINLRRRYNEYLDELHEREDKPRTLVYMMLKQYNNYLSFYYTQLDTNEKVDDCEAKLINTIVPPINRLIPAAKINPEIRSIL